MAAVAEPNPAHAEHYDRQARLFDTLAGTREEELRVPAGQILHSGEA
jgi:hypothetical protein